MVAQLPVQSGMAHITGRKISSSAQSGTQTQIETEVGKIKRKKKSIEKLRSIESSNSFAVHSIKLFNMKTQRTSKLRAAILLKL